MMTAGELLFCFGAGVWSCVILSHFGGPGDDFRSQKNGTLRVWSDKADIRIIGGRIMGTVLYIVNHLLLEPTHVNYFLGKWNL